ncbi:hypothetical protein GWK36_10960 [Caldichromatium japonicum]|uniref:Yip1 domain-containing protein n=1 Tax=Caldichromatium japonicum TaxID=2699430 RepID=A0A6G7VEB1_9GAMM|nr:hypothetical protein [Caldichromatium japonicum]QIK38413.1 hypothetical protein GWK36_10960 [Caldichromatium japonicum]
MWVLIQFFVELCLLRRRPQEIPPSDALLILIMVVDLVVGTLVGITAGVPGLVSLLQSGAELALLLAGLYAALVLLKHPARFLQASTALLGSRVVIGLTAIPPLLLNLVGGRGSALVALGAFILLGLLVWGILVTGHILRHTFSITLGQGTAIALAFQILVVTVITGLFGTA